MRKIAFIGILMLFMTPSILIADQHKEISKEEAMKYYCIKWRNPAYDESDNDTGVKIMYKNCDIAWYSDEDAKEPMWYGFFEIKKSWIDQNGNIWLNMMYDIRGWTKYTVAKISNHGNTLEQVYSYEAYPTEIGPDVKTYFIMYKK